MPLAQSCNFKQKARSEMSEYQKQDGANQIASHSVGEHLGLNPLFTADLHPGRA